MRPTVRQLEYLVALASTRHFGHAAAAAHVSQPGLSAQIKELERALGVQLFERDRRGVLLTTAGAAAVERAQRVLGELDAMAEGARGSARPLVGTLRLGVIPTVAPYLLPRVLPRVRKRWPELRLLLREDQTRHCLEQLRDGRLDAAVLALPVEGAEFENVKLFDEPFLCAMPRSHPLAARKFLKEEDLDGEDVLLLEDGHCLREQALSVCARAGAREREDFRATSLGTLLQMVANGNGITLVPALAADPKLVTLPDVTIRPFRGKKAGRTVGLCWRHTSARGPEFKLLARALAGD